VSVLIRTGVPDDALGIARVHVAAWQAGYRGLLPPAFLAGLSVERRADRWAVTLGQTSGASTTLVAARGTDLLGFASVGPSRDEDAEPSTAELWAIYAAPEHWGTGVGHQLHEAALDVVRGSGATQATLWVLHGNDRAVRFYERHGWLADGSAKTDWRDDVRLDELRYRRQLGTHLRTGG
jgi:GNAT superfamily N-acetyltransferase